MGAGKLIWNAAGEEVLSQVDPNVFLETVKGWWPGLARLGYRLLVALLILFIGNRVVRLVRRLLQKTLDRTSMDASVGKFLLSVTEVVIYTLTVFIAADSIGIPSASIIALLGSAGLAVGLSLQESLKNVAGGIFLMLMRPFGVGNFIIFKDVEGVVDSIGLVYTTLVTLDNRKITIPNGSISNDVVVNVTVAEKRRLNLEVGIGYESDMKLAKKILQNLYEQHPLILSEEGIQVFVGELGESAVMLGARGWVKTEDYWPARWELTEQIKEAFDQAGIEIPYRKLDVRMIE